MSESIKPEHGSIARPDTILDGVAIDTWQAYNAMETTKRRHYELLEILDNKKKNYNLDPSQKESSLLACLLRDHDEQVKRFTVASSALKKVDAVAHRALFTYIGELSDVEPQVTH
ncbi:MAG: hypothetical protein AB8B97_14260 [Granulosicoccus sp.]